MSDLSVQLTSNKHIKNVAEALEKASKNKLSQKEIADIIRKEQEAEKQEIAPKQATLEDELRAHSRKGTMALVATVALVTAFAGLMPLSGAVTVGGTFTVQSSPKKIQHQTGGIVKEILVHDGSRVKSGDILLKLDNTDIQAKTDSLSRQIDELTLRIARLTAERDNSAIIFPNKFLVSPGEHERMVTAERDLMKARTIQLNKQIKGLQYQLESSKKQLESIDFELKGMEELLAKKVTPVSRVTPLRREQARLIGIINDTKEKIEETNATYRANVLHDLNDSMSKKDQLLEMFIVAKSSLGHTDIYSPINGTVQGLNVHTINGIITPAEILMTVIPQDETLEIIARLPIDKIDQVKTGQSARIKLTAFTRTTPDINGIVNYVSPDSIEGKYYEIKIAVDQHPLGLTLSPGMPAEIFLDTDKRTMLSYLTKPLIEQTSKMFIER